jgi:hypothetical protein
MKKRIVALAFLISAVVSVTSGCMVQDRYGDHRHRNDRYHNGYNDNNDHGHYHDHDNRGY